MARAASQSKETPVPPRAVAYLRVDQDAAYQTLCVDLPELPGYDFGACAVAVHLPMQRLNQTDLSVEDFVQLPQPLETDAAVELHRGQPALLRDGCDLLGVEGREDADALEAFGQMRGDPRHLGCSDLTRARRKDEADGVGAKFSGQLCIVEVGVARRF